MPRRRPRAPLSGPFRGPLGFPPRSPTETRLASKLQAAPSTSAGDTPPSPQKPRPGSGRVTAVEGPAATPRAAPLPLQPRPPEQPVVVRGSSATFPAVHRHRPPVPAFSARSGSGGGGRSRASPAEGAPEEAAGAVRGSPQRRCRPSHGGSRGGEKPRRLPPFPCPPLPAPWKRSLGGAAKGSRPGREEGPGWILAAAEGRWGRRALPHPSAASRGPSPGCLALARRTAPASPPRPLKAAS